MSNSFNDRVRGDLLREWRESQKIDVCALASKATLSIAQIQQLESGGTSLFYTQAIKESAARKVAFLLGRDPADVIRPLADVDPPLSPSVMNELIELTQTRSQEAKREAIVSPRPRWWAISLFSFSCLLAAMGWFVHTIHGKGQSVDFPQMAMLKDSSVASKTSSDQPSQPITNATEVRPSDNTREEAIGLNVKGLLADVGSEVPVVPVVQAYPVSGSPCQPIEPAQQRHSDTVLMPAQARKPGNMVHLVALKEGGVCVIDGAGQSTAMSLKVSESRSVYGSPPWRVHFEATEQVQLFFQGVRLRMPDPLVTAVVLREGALMP